MFVIFAWSLSVCIKNPLACLFFCQRWSDRLFVVINCNTSRNILKVVESLQGWPVKEEELLHVGCYQP